jgi:hypothetical protein
MNTNLTPVVVEWFEASLIGGLPELGLWYTGKLLPRD